MNAFVTLAALVFGSAHAVSPPWEIQVSGTTSRLRGLSVVDENVAWASGTGGTVLRTTDGGITWKKRPVPDAEALDFRDIHVFDRDQAVLMACGPGEKSRLFKTADGGASWKITFRGSDESVFLDALSFADDRRGVALGDPVDGRFLLLGSRDGGETWQQVEPKDMPLALAAEAAFAASGTCLTTGRGGLAWFVTGGPNGCRAFSTTDEGQSWFSADLPIRADRASAGAFSVALAEHRRLIAVGGDFLEPSRSNQIVAVSKDGGRSWKGPDGRGPRGYRSCVAVVPGTYGRVLVAVGPTGSDFSSDGGESWKSLGDDGFDAVAFVTLRTGWAVGEGGRIARFRGNWPASSP